MSTGDGAELGGDREKHDERERGDRIGVGGGDESVSRIQLAARWAEAYARPADSLGSILKRFRAAYEFLDAVTHGVEPAELDRSVWDATPTLAPSPPVS